MYRCVVFIIKIFDGWLQLNVIRCPWSINDVTKPWYVRNITVSRIKELAVTITTRYCLIGRCLKFWRHCTFGPPPPPYCCWWLSWKNAAESFTLALTLTGYESAVAPKFFTWKWASKTQNLKISCLKYAWAAIFRNADFSWGSSYLVSFVSGKPNQKKQFTKLKTW